jgi:hypothetical protein
MDISDRFEDAAELVKELRERAERAEALADAERERANLERERADRYERQRDEALARLLPPAKSPGWFSRMFR